MTDALRIELVEQSQETYKGVDLLVNGRSIRDIAAAVERYFDAELAGAYGLVPLEWITDRHLLGEVADQLNARTGKVALLVCDGCLRAGCWPLVALVDVQQDVVAWTEFEQPHRPGWDYGDLSFRFERTADEQELQKVRPQ